MAPFYVYQWEIRRDLCHYFVIVVQYAQFERLRQSVATLVNGPLSFVMDASFSLMYAAVIQFVPVERERMMPYLVTNIGYYLGSSESAVLLKEVINFSTPAEKVAILPIFEGYLRMAMPLPPYIENLMTHLLVSMSSSQQRAFIQQYQEFLQVHAPTSLNVIYRYANGIQLNS
jgi:hypothetical protein